MNITHKVKFFLNPNDKDTPENYDYKIKQIYKGEWK